MLAPPTCLPHPHACCRYVVVVPESLQCKILCSLIDWSSCCFNCVGGKKGTAAEEEAGALFVVVKNGKEGRMKDEEKMKTLKWNFGQPRKEHVEQLKEQMQPCVSSVIHVQLFHDDFKKHITALDTLTKVSSKGGGGKGAVYVSQYCVCVCVHLFNPLHWIKHQTNSLSLVLSHDK